MSYGISVRYLALFCLSSVIDGFEWFWMGSLQKNIQLILEFLKASSLVLYFSCYTLMTFSMLLSVIFKCNICNMLMILLLSSLIIANNWSLLLNLNLIYKAPWTGAGSVLLISMLEKLNLFHFTCLITLVLLM